MMANQVVIRIVRSLLFSAAAILVALGAVFVLATPVSAQAEVREDPSVEVEETLEPGGSNGHEFDTLEEDDSLTADDNGGERTETDAEISGVRISFVLFIVGIGAALIFLFLFFQKFILRKP